MSIDLFLEQPQLKSIKVVHGLKNGDLFMETYRHTRDAAEIRTNCELGPKNKKKRTCGTKIEIIIVEHKKVN